MFVYAGFLYVTGGASPGSIEKAHKIFWSVFMGLFITLAAWLVVDLLMSTFLSKDFGPWNKIECVARTTSTGGGGEGTKPPTTKTPVNDNICYEQLTVVAAKTTINPNELELCADPKDPNCQKSFNVAFIAKPVDTYKSKSECTTSCNLACSSAKVKALGSHAFGKCSQVCSDEQSLNASTGGQVKIDPNIIAPVGQTFAQAYAASIRAASQADELAFVGSGQSGSVFVGRTFMNESFYTNLNATNKSTSLAQARAKFKQDCVSGSGSHSDISGGRIVCVTGSTIPPTPIPPTISASITANGSPNKLTNFSLNFGSESRSRIVISKEFPLCAPRFIG